MGIAAYNRGSQAITNQIKADLAPFEEHPGAAAIRERIDQITPGATRLFMSTVARPDPGPGGGWLLMNHPDRGYGESARSFHSLDEIRRSFQVTLGAYGQDKHSYFWEVLAVPAKACGSGYRPA